MWPRPVATATASGVPELTPWPTWAMASSPKMAPIPEPMPVTTGREGPTGQISAGFASLLARELDLSPADSRIDGRSTRTDGER